MHQSLTSSLVGEAIVWLDTLEYLFKWLEVAALDFLANSIKTVLRSNYQYNVIWCAMFCNSYFLTSWVPPNIRKPRGPRSKYAIVVVDTRAPPNIRKPRGPHSKHAIVAKCHSVSVDNHTVAIVLWLSVLRNSVSIHIQQQVGCPCAKLKWLW
jgi:hypothetical protein